MPEDARGHTWRAGWPSGSPAGPRPVPGSPSGPWPACPCPRDPGVCTEGASLPAEAGASGLSHLSLNRQKCKIRREKLQASTPTGLQHPPRGVPTAACGSLSWQRGFSQNTKQRDRALKPGPRAGSVCRLDFLYQILYSIFLAAVTSLIAEGWEPPSVSGTRPSVTLSQCALRPESRPVLLATSSLSRGSEAAPGLPSRGPPPCRTGSPPSHGCLGVVPACTAWRLLSAAGGALILPRRLAAGRDWLCSLGESRPPGWGLACEPEGDSHLNPLHSLEPWPRARSLGFRRWQLLKTALAPGAAGPSLGTCSNTWVGPRTHPHFLLLQCICNQSPNCRGNLCFYLQSCQWTPQSVAGGS